MLAAVSDSMSYWAWSIAVGFPVLTIVLTESIHRLQRRNHPLAHPAHIIRSWVLPAVAIWLLLTQVIGLDRASIPVRLVQTGMFVCLLYLALAFLGSVLFAASTGDTWRSRTPKLFVDLLQAFFVLLGGAIIVSSVWGQDLGGMLTALGVGSIVIGLALQDTLGNVMSGIALLFERPFSEGDWIRVGDHVGEIIEMNWRAVRIQNRELEYLVVPNSVLAKETFTNFSRPIREHYEVYDIGFSYNTPPNEAKDMLLEITRATPGVLSEPKPLVFTISYDDSAITYRIKFAISDFRHQPMIRDALSTRIWYAAKRRKIVIPFPIRTLEIDRTPSITTEDHQKSMLRYIDTIPALAGASPATRDMLSRGCALEWFGQGEPVVTAGETVKCLGFLLDGSIDLYIPYTTGSTDAVITTLQPHDCFGALGVFTGAPSPVTARAVSDVSALVIPADLAKDLLGREPRLAREIGQLLDDRSQLVEKARSQNIAMLSRRMSNGTASDLP